MPSDNSQRITDLLVEWNGGNDLALDELVPLVYDELRGIASRYLRKQNSGHTFQTTELVHEAYVKLSNQQNPAWQNRAHFFSLAAKAMRHILVDHARTKNAEKRGGGNFRVTLDEDMLKSSDNAFEMLALDTALNKLAELDERKCRVVELKYFGGLTYEEIAEFTGISIGTVKRDLRFSRSWLLREISA